MSLRPMFYGFKLQQFIDALGQKNDVLFDTVAAELSKSFQQEADLTKAKAWLRTLIHDGYPLRRNRKPPTVSNDGGLLMVQQETTVHMRVAFKLIQAVAGKELLDLSESSIWNYSAVEMLINDMFACQYWHSEQCPKELIHVWMPALRSGTPLFGDEFCTKWSFYTVFEHPEVEGLRRALDSAIEFEREVPESEIVRRAKMPDGHPNKVAVTRLSQNGKQFAEELSGWLARIHEAGLDAFVYWA